MGLKDLRSWGGLKAPRSWGAFAAAAVFALDRASKGAILDFFEASYRQEIAIGPYINIVMVWNRGMSFGMFNDHGAAGRWALAIVALGIVAGLAVWLFRTTDRWLALALGFVIGGAIGNIFDRLVYGAVADFVDVHYNMHHWPAFNVADSAILIGVVIMLWDVMFRKRSA